MNRTVIKLCISNLKSKRMTYEAKTKAGFRNDSDSATALAVEGRGGCDSKWILVHSDYFSWATGDWATRSGSIGARVREILGKGAVCRRGTSVNVQEQCCECGLEDVHSCSTSNCACYNSRKLHIELD